MTRIGLTALAIVFTASAIVWGTIKAVHTGHAIVAAHYHRQHECEIAWFGLDGKGQRFLEECRLPAR